MCAFSQRKPTQRQKFHTLITLGRSRYTYILSEEGDPVLLHQSDEVFCSVAAKDWQTDGIVAYINHVFLKAPDPFGVFPCHFFWCMEPPQNRRRKQDSKNDWDNQNAVFCERGQTLQMDYLKPKKRPSHGLPKEFKTHELIEFWEKKSRVPTLTPCPAGTKLPGIQGAVSKKRLRATRIWSFPPRQKA